MQAAVYSKYGDPDVLEIREIPKPVPGDNEILINRTFPGNRFADALDKNDRRKKGEDRPDRPEAGCGQGQGPGFHRRPG